MGWLEMVAVLLVTAIAAGAGGFWASVLAQRKKSRARGPFLVGVLCGLMAGVALTRRLRGLNAIRAHTLKAVIRPLRPELRTFDGAVAGALGIAASLVRRGPATVARVRR